MRFYQGQHRFYCGIDLHARTMYLCILEHDGNIVWQIAGAQPRQLRETGRRGTGSRSRTSDEIRSCEACLRSPSESEQQRGTVVQLRLEGDRLGGSTAQERLPELLGSQVGRPVVHQPRAAVADACAHDPGSDDGGEHDRALTAVGRERSVRAFEQ